MKKEQRIIGVGATSGVAVMAATAYMNLGILLTCIYLILI